MQNIAGEKRVRQEDLDSGYLFGSFFGKGFSKIAMAAEVLSEPS
jgi:hypothetical protein